MKEYKHLYGPVYSWRLGMSLGVDPLSHEKKICNLDCTYCQLGRTSCFVNERKVFVPTHEIINEFQLLPKIHVDYITICGKGEPTLAKNLGTIIDNIREVRKEKIAVITNSTFMDNVKVRGDLLKADFVLAKLDAFSQDSFMTVGRSMCDLKFSNVIQGIKSFRKVFRGKLALQIMFVDENKESAKEIAEIARDIRANEIEINTPLRPSASRPLSKDELSEIKKCFASMPAITVYEKNHRDCKPLCERETIQRHGNYM